MHKHSICCRTFLSHEASICRGLIVCFLFTFQLSLFHIKVSKCWTTSEQTLHSMIHEGALILKYWQFVYQFLQWIGILHMEITVHWPSKMLITRVQLCLSGRPKSGEYLLFIHKTLTMWFCTHSMHTKVWIWGHRKKIHEMHGIFGKNNSRYSDSLQFHLIKFCVIRENTSSGARNPSYQFLTVPAIPNSCSPL